MFGTISQYDPQKEVGEVEGEDGLSYAFSLMDAYDFSSPPKIGQHVEFGTEEGLLYYLKPSSKAPLQKSTPEVFDGIAPVIHEKTPPVEIDLPISLEVSVMEQLKKERESNPKNAALESKYKRYNGMYVDVLHRMASLRDENVMLLRELKAFEQTHFSSFVSEFTRFSTERKEQILRLLDGYAYYFDKKMWDLAESSKSIHEFFRKANVQDEFSSKTYLKYYLKGLHENQLHA